MPTSLFSVLGCQFREFDLADMTPITAMKACWTNGNGTVVYG